VGTKAPFIYPTTNFIISLVICSFTDPINTTWESIMYDTELDVQNTGISKVKVACALKELTT
jgi:hypothetical protein